MNTAHHLASDNGNSTVGSGDGNLGGEIHPLLWLSVLSLVIAIVYFAAGYLGKSLAIPPGNVTLLWPPSGIALGLVLQFGWRAVPGIWLGAVASNVEGFADAADAAGMAVIGTGVIIGIGSVLQPMAGSWAIRRWIGSRSLILEGSAFARFMIIVPIMCLISSSIGTSSLVSADLIGTDQWSSTLLTWWTGDLIGAVLFTPLTRAVFQERRQKLLWIVAILCVGYGGSFYSGELIRRQATATWEETVRTEAERHSGTLISWLESTAGSVASMAALFIGSGHVTEDEFLSAVEVLEGTQTDFFPSSLAFAVAEQPDGKASDVSNLDWAIRISTEIDGPLSPRIVTQVGVGSTVRAAIVDAVGAAGTVRLSAFRQDLDGQSMLFLTTSVGSKNEPGVLIGTIPLDNLVDGLTTLRLRRGITVRVSGRAASEDRNTGPTSLVGGAKANAGTVMSVTKRMPVAGAELTLHWDASADFNGGPSFDLGNAIFFGAMLGTSFLALFMMFLVLQNEQISLHVDERTRQVQENALRAERTAATLSEKENQLKSALDAMSDGFFMVDHEKRIVLFNERLADQFGVPSEFLRVGETFFDAVFYLAQSGAWGPGDAKELAQKGIDGIFSGEAKTVETKAGDGRRLETRVVPMADGGTVGIVTDVTERRQSEKKLRENMQEAEQFNRLAVGREMRMIELKTEINGLLADLGKSSRYDIFE